jgi:hypothetical protein
MTVEEFSLSITALLFISIFGWFIFMSFKNGGLKGAVLGGKIKRTVGQIGPVIAMMGKTTIKVHEFDTTGKYNAVCMEIVNTTMLSYTLEGIRLSRDEATKLANMLLEASKKVA